MTTAKLKAWIYEFIRELLELLNQQEYDEDDWTLDAQGCLKKRTIRLLLDHIKALEDLYERFKEVEREIARQSLLRRAAVLKDIEGLQVGEGVVDDLFTILDYVDAEIIKLCRFFILNITAQLKHLKLVNAEVKDFHLA